MDTNRFDFEQLIVWQKAVEYASVAIDIAENLNSERTHYKLIEQLESACTSISMNIAEGKGRGSNKSYILHLRYARGSLYESITLIEVFHLKQWIAASDRTNIRQMAFEIVKMLNALITAIAARK